MVMDNFIEQNLVTNSIHADTELLSSVQIGLYFTLLDKCYHHIKSPIDGILIIVQSNCTESCCCTYSINQNDYHLDSNKSSLISIKTNDLLRWENSNNQYPAIAVFAPIELFTELDLTKHDIGRSFHNGVAIKTTNNVAFIVNQILEIHNNPTPLSKLRIQSLLLEVLAFQLERIYTTDKQRDIPTIQSHYEKILLAKKIIDEDLSNHFTLMDLAKQIGTNEQYLKKYFKQYVGKTVMNYITAQRMYYAKELIKSGKYRVIDVAQMTGYRHATHFTTAFKKFFGFIPNSLRY